MGHARGWPRIPSITLDLHVTGASPTPRPDAHGTFNIVAFPSTVFHDVAKYDNTDHLARNGKHNNDNKSATNNNIPVSTTILPPMPFNWSSSCASFAMRGAVAILRLLF